MNKKTNQNGFLGVDFVRRMTKCLIEDQSFLEAIFEGLDPNMLPSEYRRVVGFIKELYSNYHTVTYTALEDTIRLKVTDPINVEQFLARVQEIKDLELSQDVITYIKEYASTFLQQQSIVKVINQMKDIVDKGEYSKFSTISTMVEKALTVGVDEGQTRAIESHIQEDLSDQARVTVPMGIDEIDETLKGGLGKGELGIIIAPSGVGKTSFCIGLGANAAIKNFKVLHYVFEDSERSIRCKYYAFVLSKEIEWDVEADDLADPMLKPFYLKVLNETPLMASLNENLRIERLVDATVEDIEAKIKRSIAKGFKPDMVIIDYFECLKHTQNSTDTMWTAEGGTMRKMDALCAKYDIALWVPIQSTKAATKKGNVAMNEGSGAVQKIQVAHTVITLAGTDDMKALGLLNISVEKFREGRLIKTKFPFVEFNPGSGIVETEYFTKDTPLRMNKHALQLHAQCVE